MSFRRQKRFFYLLIIGTAFLFLIYITGYTPVLFGSDPHVKRPHIRFEDVADQIDHRKPRIMINWIGRMGNHLFEYACLLGIAKWNNMTPIISPTVDILDVFNLPAPQGSLSLLRDPINYFYPVAAKFDNATMHLQQRDYYLTGYRQSWKYFEHVKEDLLNNHFVFHEPILATAMSYINAARKEKNKPDAVIVGVHVRRGDFVRQRIKGFTVAPIPFYFKTMNYFRRNYPNVLFIICTNDYFWALDNLDHGPDVFYSTNTDGAVDLAIMANCDHMIITSGTYSWWAGYLVRGEVIYYKGYPEPNTIIGNQTVREDYYPPNWIGM